MELLLIALAPVVVLAIFIYKKDKKEKEPASMLVKAFLAGIGSLILTGLTGDFFDVETDINENFAWYIFGEAFIEAAIPEELFKFICLMFVVWKSKYFDEHFDGIVYAAFVGLGFAGVENIMYVFENGAGVGIMRAILAVPGHFLDGVVMGYFLSLAKFGPVDSRTKNLIFALLMPIITHGTYDGCCFAMELLDNEEMAAVGVLIFIFFIIFNFKLWKQCLKRIKEQAEKDATSPAIANDK